MFARETKREKEKDEERMRRMRRKRESVCEREGCLWFCMTSVALALLGVPLNWE